MSKILDAHSRQSNTIEAEIRRDIRGKKWVRYGVGLPGQKWGFTPLRRIAIKGKVRFLQKHDPFFGEGRNYESKVLENPTWLEVAVTANNMIRTIGDHHHVFLEGVTITNEETKIQSARFEMGS